MQSTYGDVEGVQVGVDYAQEGTDDYGVETITYGKIEHDKMLETVREPMEKWAAQKEYTVTAVFEQTNNLYGRVLELEAQVKRQHDALEAAVVDRTDVLRLQFHRFKEDADKNAEELGGQLSALNKNFTAINLEKGALEEALEHTQAELSGLKRLVKKFAADVLERPNDVAKIFGEPIIKQAQDIIRATET